MKRTKRFQWMAALMLGMAMTCVTMITSCTAEDNPVDVPGDVPNVGGATVKELSELTTAEIGWVIGADGKAYSSVWQAMANHTETVADLTYISKTPDEVLHFLAIAHRDEKEPYGGYKFNWHDAKARCEGKDKIAGCEWRLPSLKDWELMIFGNYAERSDRVECDDFWSLQISTGFEDLAQNWYWTSEYKDEGNGMMKVRMMGFRYEGVHMYADFSLGWKSYDDNNVARAVLAYNM